MVTALEAQRINPIATAKKPVKKKVVEISFKETIAEFQRIKAILGQLPDQKEEKRLKMAKFSSDNHKNEKTAIPKTETPTDEEIIITEIDEPEIPTSNNKADKEADFFALTNKDKPLEEVLGYLLEEGSEKINSISIYWAEIRNTALLKPEEEIALAKTMAEQNNKAKAITATGNIEGKAKTELDKANKLYFEARESLVNANLRLAFWLAKKYIGRGLPLEDLTQEANLGLIKAAEKFNYTKGYRFSTYASWWIKNGILNSLAASPTVPLTTWIQTQAIRVRNFQDRLGQASLTEIAKGLNIKPEAVRAYLRVIYPPARLDETVREKRGDQETNATLGELIPHLETGFEKIEDTITHRTAIIAILRNPDLTLREKLTFMLHSGIAGTRYQLNELTIAFNVSDKRVDQYYRGAVNKLRKDPYFLDLTAS